VPGSSGTNDAVARRLLAAALLAPPAVGHLQGGALSGNGHPQEEGQCRTEIFGSPRQLRSSGPRVEYHGPNDTVDVGHAEVFNGRARSPRDAASMPTAGDVSRERARNAIGAGGLSGDRPRGAALLGRGLPKPAPSWSFGATATPADSPSWQSMVAAWQAQPLRPDEMEVLREFKQSAETQEQDLLEQLRAKRSAYEARWEHDAALLQLKFSRAAQDARATERSAVRKQLYLEAAAAKKLAERLEADDRARRAKESEQQAARHMARVAQQETAALQELQHRLREQLWACAYTGQLPTLPKTAFRPGAEALSSPLVEVA